MVIVVMEVHLHSFHHVCSDQPFDGGFLLVVHLLFFDIVPMPLGGEEIGEPSQSLSFSLDFSFVLTKLPQPDDVYHDTCVANCFDHSSYCPIHLEAFP